MIGVVVWVLIALSPNAGAAVNTCRARNMTRGTPRVSDLQAVIDAAHGGDRIAVKFVCVGTFTIDKKLALVGKPTPGVLTPVLTANGRGRVLLVTARVSLIGLKVTGGRATYGAGIKNKGTLRLNDIVVRGNAATSRGGGISNLGGTVILNDTIVRDNEAASLASEGGGISNFGGTLILNGRSSVHDNASHYGGGILNDGGGSITLNDSSSVRSNTAPIGGGMATSLGTISLNDSAVVAGNAAAYGGGGIFNAGAVTMNDSSSVRRNTAMRGGGIYNSFSDDLRTGAPLNLRSSARVTGNKAKRSGGGIWAARFPTISACDSSGVEEWIGAISPNAPDDPPPVTLIPCT
jgi:hypothetical protein